MVFEGTMAAVCLAQAMKQEEEALKANPSAPRPTKPPMPYPRDPLTGEEVWHAFAGATLLRTFSSGARRTNELSLHKGSYQIITVFFRRKRKETKDSQCSLKLQDQPSPLQYVPVRGQSGGEVHFMPASQLKALQSQAAAAAMAQAQAASASSPETSSPSTAEPAPEPTTQEAS
jgi:hypothetical protein